MTYLVAKPYSPRGSGRGECINNGRQALPSLVRPRFLPGDQKGPDPRVYRVLERSIIFRETRLQVAFSALLTAITMKRSVDRRSHPDQVQPAACKTIDRQTGSPRVPQDLFVSKYEQSHVLS
jgi:hypothetical protein